MKPVASIIVPTWNNPEYLIPSLDSIAKTGSLDGLCELIVVNNGDQPLDYLKDWPNTKVIKPKSNLGWEGGLQAGLQVAEGDFICFQNDDTFIPKATQSFYSQLLWPFQNKNVAAVGPATTIASGWHSIFQKSPLRQLTEVSYLIFFTVMLRRSDLEAAGGIDTSAPGGDDLDLSIRLRKMGKHLLINPDAFLIHHAFKTGTRIRGDHTVAGGWNSKDMIDKTNQWLIQKHGFKMFMETMRGLSYQNFPSIDTEGETVRQFVRGPKIVELGCGFRKTVPQAIGVDHSAKGEHPTNLHDGKECVADVQADVTKQLPRELYGADTAIARHVLEHSVNTVETLKHWNAILKMDGRLIIAVPNQDVISSIPLNPEHVHAFTPESLKAIAELCGFKQIEIKDPQNGISFVTCFEKVLDMSPLNNGMVLETANA